MSSKPKTDEPLEIESEELDDSIRYLANDLHVSKLEAVELAVDELEARLRAEERVKSGVAAKLVAIGRESKHCFDNGTDDLTKELYDDAGMPH